MKTALSFALVLALSSVACNSNDDGNTNTAPPTTLEPGERQITPDELESIIDPIPEAGIDSYRALAITYRSYGSNMEALSAVVTRTDLWQSQTVHVGDTLARNLRVVAINPDSVTLENGSGEQLSLPTNQDVTIDAINHDIDVAVRAELGHRYTVTAPYLAQANQLVGLGADAFSEHIDQLGHGALQITSIDKGGVIDRLGFEKGDIIVTINGQPADQGAGSLNQLVRLLASGGERIVQVEMVRGPDAITTTYVVKGSNLSTVQR